jgi:hypothetical protein
MKRILFSPLYNYPANRFTGDNLSHYHPAKYLWNVCNETKTGYFDPVYDFEMKDEISLAFVFYPQHPQHIYFKKPRWIDEFLVAKDEAEVNQIARGYDYFVNQYRYRGCIPSEVNSGYTPDLPEINLHTVAATYKAVNDLNLYLDDLELSDRYAEFLSNVEQLINPEHRPIIVLHHRGNDPWGRHLFNSIGKYEYLLDRLLARYPDHVFVLVGETWGNYHHPRIKRLKDYITVHACHKFLGEHNACLQFVLSVYFCRNVDMVFIGISGFTLFLESIRPTGLKPPIPVLWGPETFSGNCTFVSMMQKKAGWCCPEFEDYRRNNPQDEAYQPYVHHFLYYSRNNELLKPYCLDYPNSATKVFQLIQQLETRFGGETVSMSLLPEGGNGFARLLMHSYRAYHYLYSLFYVEIRSLLLAFWRTVSARRITIHRLISRRRTERVCS